MAIQVSHCLMSMPHKLADSLNMQNLKDIALPNIRGCVETGKTVASVLTDDARLDKHSAGLSRNHRRRLWFLR